MLKDIYSPLEIDDQWDQRAPVHEDKAEGGNADGMGTSTPGAQVEDPSGGGVAVMEQPPEDLPVTPAVTTETTQVANAPGNTLASEVPATEATPDTSNLNGVPGMQTPRVTEPTIGNEMPEATETQVTNGDSTQVAGEENVFQPTDSGVSDEAETAAPTTMESTTDGSTGNNPASSETADIDGSNNAGETTAPMGDVEAVNTLGDSDIATSDYGKPIESSVDSDASNGDETPAEPNHEIEMATPSYEPDTDHRAKADEQDEKEAVEKIVQEPLGDDEMDKISSDAEQSPVSPEPDNSETVETHDTNGEDEVAAEIKKAEDEVLKVIDNKLEAHRARKEKLEAQLAKFEQEKTDADAQATATQAQIDQVEAAIDELESKK